MTTTQIPSKSSALPYNKSPTVENESSDKRDSSGCLKIEDRENGNNTRETTRNLENEKNKQVIENSDINGNNTASKGSLSTGFLSSLSSSSSSTLYPSSVEAQNQISSVILAPRREQFLFEKKFYKSNVNNLNRLVIPRKFAEAYFPSLKIAKDKYKKESLVFFDHQSIAWDRKFEFWESSQSYGLTRGWKAFVNQYQLQPNFLVGFYQLDNFIDKKHYGIRYVVQVPIKTIRLFGHDCHYLCLDEIKDHNLISGIRGYGNNDENGSNCSNGGSGQNKIVGEGKIEEAAMNEDADI